MAGVPLRGCYGGGAYTGVPISDKSDESDRSDRSDAELDVVAGLGRPTCLTCPICPTCPIRYRPLSDKAPALVR